MVKILLDVEGMACGMCEAHVNEAIRNNFKVKKVRSSHLKKTTEIIAEAEIDGERLRSAVESVGYKVNGVRTEPYEKRFFPFFGK